eukprot:GHVU01026187.1.p1 GENE.GHVU01026187.1~~GHVU01026187.1.p1  ORF type:complete len:107 (+),score=8.73 GHVU01026187.1:90-410(+)
MQLCGSYWSQFCSRHNEPTHTHAHAHTHTPYIVKEWKVSRAPIHPWAHRGSMIEPTADSSFPCVRRSSYSSGSGSSSSSYSFAAAVAADTATASAYYCRYFLIAGQ